MKKIIMRIIGWTLALAGAAVGGGFVGGWIGGKLGNAISDYLEIKN